MKPLRRMTALVLGLVLALGLLSPAAASADNAHPFTDMMGNPNEATVTALWQLGIVSGSEPGKYNPSGTVTRAQMATFIIRAMGKTAEADALKDTATGFADTPPTHWARGFIVLGNRMGIVTGSDGLFHPDDKVNYAQATTMLIRALGYGNQVTGGYPVGYVMMGNQVGLLQDVHFSLLEDLTRSEAAQMLYNAVYRVPGAATELTWSQSIYKQATGLTFEALPAYVAPGQALTMKAAAKDPVGRPIPSADIKYQIMSGSATLSGNTLTVGSGGAIEVKATLGDLAATAATTAVTGLTISPATFKANKGGTVQFTAAAQAGAQSVPVTPLWQVTGPGTIDKNGLLTVTDYGSVTVKASLGSLTASATGQAVGKVAITDKPAFLVPGLPGTFSATASDTAGQPVVVPITWSAIGAQIDQSGRLTNPSAAQVVVTATAGGISDQVTIPTLQSIQVSPAIANLLTGKQQSFSAKGLDAAGHPYDVDVTWTHTNSAVGVLGGNGTFAGTGSGATDILATMGTLQGRTHLTVSGPPTTLSVTSTATLLPVGSGQTATINVRLLDATGAVSAVDDQPITFTLLESTGATLNKALLLTQKGVGTAIFTVGTVAGNSSVQVQAPGTGLTPALIPFSSYAASATHIHLIATPQPLATGGGIATITAILSDANNYPVKATSAIPILLNNATSAAGGLTNTSIVIPAGGTSASTTFISGSLPSSVVLNGTASSTNFPVETLLLQVNNTGAAAGVKIRPIADGTPINGLSSMQVLVDVVDSVGTVRAGDNSSQVQLSVRGPGSEGTPVLSTATVTGGTAVFQIPGTAVGTVAMTASLVATPAATDTATALFIAGISASLRLTTSSTALAADGYSQSQVIAEVMDRAGNVISNVNPQITFRKLSDGGATSAVGSLTVQARDGRAVLALQSTRAGGSDVWYASVPGLETQNLATISTTAVSGTAYALRVGGSTTFGVAAPGTLTVQVVDQQGRVVINDPPRTITASHTMGGVTVTNTAITSNGVALFTVASAQTTSGTVNFATTGLISLAVPVAFGTGGTAYSLFVSSNPTSARTGQSIIVSVRVMDSQGMLLTSDNGRAIAAAITTGNATLAASTVTTVAGLASFTVIGTGTGTVSLTFTAPGLAQPQQTLNLTFTP